jgi:hypothetical protein
MSDFFRIKKERELTIAINGEDTSKLSSKIVGSAVPERFGDMTMIS